MRASAQRQEEEDARVTKGLNSSHSPLWVPHEKPRDHINRLCARRRQELPKITRFSSPHIAHKSPRLLALNEIELLIRRRAAHVRDEAELVNVVLPREERFPQVELSDDATNGPHIDCTRVL